MIPKKIHYCWFGGNPLPELAQKCIASWEKYCPDYEIIQWNESNFDVTCCDYIKEAYEAKKWAFVSDYARFKILYEQGGLYFDTDVEILKSLEPIVEKGNFMGREEGINVNPGLGIGATAGDPLYEEMLSKYATLHFRNADGSLNMKTVVEYTTEMLIEYGLLNNNEIQHIRNVFIYPKDYFCPMDYTTGELMLTDNSCSIHHYTASWYDETQKYAMKLKRKYGKILPRKPAAILATAVSKAKYEGIGSCVKWIFKKR